MRFFRGIAVPPDALSETIHTIRTTGLLPGAGTWSMVYDHPGPIEELFLKEDLRVADTRRHNEAADPAACACGEHDGAAYYAYKHNRSQTNSAPIMIEFEAPESAVAVDGKDFLYTVFQMGDPMKARPILRRGFGDAVSRYADKAWGNENQQYRIAMCDLATHDPRVIAAHHSNSLVFGGRYGTTFRNAFVVKLPVAPEAVIRVWTSDRPPRLPSPDVSLRDLLRRSPSR